MSVNKKSLSPEEEQLILATEKGESSVVQHLVLSGLNPNIKNSFDENLLFLACRHGHLDVANFLLNNQVDPLQLNSGKQTILAAACLGGNPEMVKWVLELSNQPEYASLNNPRFFLYGFYPKNIGVFEYFISQGFFTENDLEKLPLYHYKDSSLLINLLKLIFHYFPSLDLEKLSYLFSKLIISHIGMNQLAAIEYMLNQYPIIKMRFNRYFPELLNAIQPAADMNQPEVINTHSQTLNNLFSFEVDQYVNPALAFLLEHGLERSVLDAEGQSLLHCAAVLEVDEYENVFHIRVLLDLGYSPELLNGNGQTSLHCAIKKGLQFHAAYLVYRGANVNAVDANGFTPLDYANQFCTAGFDPQDEENIEYRQQLIQILKDFGAASS